MFNELKNQIINDPMNQSFTEKRVEPLFYASQNAVIAIIGQAPGKKAEESGLYWDDPSGDRLREWLGLNRSQFYQTDKIAHLPMDFYFPGKAKQGDKPPRLEFAKKYHPLIIQKMPNLQTLILAGNYAQKFYLASSRKKNLTETVRAYQEYSPRYFPIVHPSPLNYGWHRKNPWFEEKVVPDLQKLIHQAVKY